MTPQQMLQHVEKQQQRPVVSSPIDNIDKTLQGVQKRYDDHLREGRCPICHASVNSTIEASGAVVFKCVPNPVFHEFRRTTGFLLRD